MLNKRNSGFFAFGVFALMMSTMAAAGDSVASDPTLADDPREWLERMNKALTTRNYDGVFSHWQDGKVEMLRIIHRVKEGEVSERLVSLDGSGREFIRKGAELACYLPDKRTVLIEKRSDPNPLLGNFPTFDEASTAFYDIKELKRTRLNRRDTRIISVTPKDEFRYGYKLWIDEGTAMPVRTQLCNSRGRVIEQLVLAGDLKINTNIADTAFQPEVSTEGFQWLRADPGIGQVLAQNNAAARWNADKLPPGFRITLRAAQVMPGSSGPVDHLVFSDGLASVSVFVETTRQSRVRLPAIPEQDLGGATVRGLSAPARTGVAQFGSTSAFSTVIEGHKVTAVGEVPPETVRFIANSVRSAVTPPVEPALAEPRPGGPRSARPSSVAPPPAPLSLQSSPRR